MVIYRVPLPLLARPSYSILNVINKDAIASNVVGASPALSCVRRPPTVSIQQVLVAIALLIWGATGTFLATGRLFPVSFPGPLSCHDGGREAVGTGTGGRLVSSRWRSVRFLEIMEGGGCE